MERRKIMVTIYPTIQQLANLKALSGHTHVPIGHYVREGIDRIIEQNRHWLTNEPVIVISSDEEP